MKKTALSKDNFAAAAIRCFERYGAQRTSMVDIAEEAGASRQSIYRFFEDRSALILYILDRRITDMAHALQETFSRYHSLEEALVEGSIASLGVSRSDMLYNNIVSTSLDLSIEQFMLHGSKQINDSMASFWGPLIDRARAENKLTKGLTNSDIIEWIRHVHTILTMRNDMDEKSMRRMLQRFLVPSIIVSAASQPPAIDGSTAPKPGRIARSRARRTPV